MIEPLASKYVEMCKIAKENKEHAERLETKCARYEKALEKLVKEVELLSLWDKTSSAYYKAKQALKPEGGEG